MLIKRRWEKINQKGLNLHNFIRAICTEQYFPLDTAAKTFFVCEPFVNLTFSLGFPAKEHEFCSEICNNMIISLQYQILFFRGNTRRSFHVGFSVFRGSRDSSMVKRKAPEIQDGEVFPVCSNARASVPPGLGIMKHSPSKSTMATVIGYWTDYTTYDIQNVHVDLLTWLRLVMG